MAEVLTIRDTLLRRVPRWLRGGRVGKLVYAVGLVLDAILEGAVQGAHAALPGHPNATDEALPLIGAERRIPRGLYESDASYALRLRGWWETNKRVGNPYGMLEQLHAYYAPSNFEIELVYYSGRRFSMAVDGTITRDDISWTPDADATRWARWWLFLHWPTPIASDGLWQDAGAWDDGGVWDSALTPDEVASFKLVPAEWNNAKCIGRVVVLSGDAELWDYPPGTWDDPGTWPDANEYPPIINVS